ncbi:uncharacterized protein METZ01_LOCUS473570, partial [marine metagenome]
MRRNVDFRLAKRQRCPAFRLAKGLADIILKYFPAMTNRILTCGALGLLSGVLIGCGPGAKPLDQGARDKVLNITVGTEPEDIDPHVVTGVPEHHIIVALTEGLVTEDPVDLHPVPGTAER